MKYQRIVHGLTVMCIVVSVASAACESHASYPPLTDAPEPYMDASTPRLGTEANPASSCQAILEASASVGDGTYWVKADNTVFQVYCDMTRDGGGLTLVLRGRKKDPTGWATVAALHLADLANRSGTNSSKASDVAINAMLKTLYRVETSNCASPSNVTTVFFAASCVYNHNLDTTGACQTFYPSSALSTPSTAQQLGSYKALSSYTTVTRPTTAVIVHDPVSGAGDDSWWSGGPNLCDLDVWLK